MMRHLLASCLTGLALAVLAAGPVAAQPAGSLLLDTPPKAGPKASASGAKGRAAPANSLLLDARKGLASPGSGDAAAYAPTIDGVTLDSPHTSATFWIRHIVAPVAGRFDAVAGRIDIPAKAVAQGRVTFAVKTQSVDTGIAARDAHLRTAEFLDAATYPEMTFASSRLAPAGKGVVNVTGTLAIKDVTRTVTIPVKLLGVKPHPMMPCVDVAGYEASFSINRLEYHVGTGKYFKMGAVGDATEIRLSGETLAERPGCVKPPQPAQAEQPAQAAPPVQPQEAQPAQP